jgi:hypothetical protein
LALFTGIVEPLIELIHSVPLKGIKGTKIDSEKLFLLKKLYLETVFYPQRDFLKDGNLLILSSVLFYQNVVRFYFSKKENLQLSCTYQPQIDTLEHVL